MMKATNSTPDVTSEPMQAAEDERSWREFQALQRAKQAREEKYQREDGELFSMLEKAAIRQMAREEAEDAIDAASVQPIEYQQPVFDMVAFESVLENTAKNTPVKVEQFGHPVQIEIVDNGQSHITEFAGWLFGIIGIIAAAVMGVAVWL